MPELLDFVTLPIRLNIKYYKKEIKNLLLKIQATGNEEWHASNFPLYYITGLRKTQAQTVNKIKNYSEQ